MGTIKKAYDRNPKLANLILDPDFRTWMDQGIADWREVIRTAVAAGARRHDFALDLDEVARVVGEARPTLTFLCSPNNPTGRADTPDEVAAVAALIWFALGYPLKTRTFNYRVAFLGFIAGGPVAFGNISVLVHASVYGAALVAGADSLLFAAVVSLVSLIKPLYLLLFTLTLFSPGSLKRKALVIAAGAVLPLASMLVTSPDILAWRETVVTMMSGPDRGGGFTNMMQIIGVTSLFGQAPLYALYGGTLLVSGVALAEFGQLDREQRIWLGGAIGVLMFPRIMCYDVLTLGPGVIAALAARPTGLSRDAGRYGGLALACCGLCFLSTLLGGLAHAWRELSYLGLVGVFALCAWNTVRGRFAPGVPAEGGRA